jgi:hypothetical protein
MRGYHSPLSRLGNEVVSGIISAFLRTRAAETSD